jgi:3-oxoacyl-[acyl-carrier protein] reductase
MGKLSGKVAVVTGASKGIGAAIATHLAAEGASVVVNYASDKKGADTVVAEIAKSGGKAIAIQANVAVESEVASLFDQTAKTYGKVDVLVNNAGVYAFAPIDSVTSDEFARLFNTNVLGLLSVTKTALPLFPETGGSIINISSVVSTMAPPTASVYAGTKGAVDTITKVLAKELGARKIRVNAVNPGLVITEGLHTAGMAGGAFEDQVVATTPLGRAGLPDDIALPVVFLASEDARWITGVTILVSGGAGI